MEEKSFCELYKEKITSTQFTLNPSIEDVTLQLEVTNFCNHHCIFCPNEESSRKRQMLDKKLAIRIMKEAAILGVKKICFHMNGEPLLYPHLKELIIYSKELGYTYSFLTTNGTVGDENLLKQIFDAGIDSIKFSINAGTRKSYQAIHGLDQYEKAIEALKFAYKYRKETKKKYKIFVSFVVTKETVNEIEEFYQEKKQYCDDILFYYVCHYAGQAIEKVKEIYVDFKDKNVPGFKIQHTLPCAVLCNSINVTCQGYLALCCSEANNLLIVENLNKCSVKEAWFGDAMTSIRKKHLEGNIVDLPCYSCVTGKVNQKGIVVANEELYRKAFD